jgi:thymidylate synthase
MIHADSSPRRKACARLQKRFGRASSSARYGPGANYTNGTFGFTNARSVCIAGRDHGSGNGYNQLEEAIVKLSTWNHRAEAALVLHLSSPQLDRPQTRGGPCLQFIELLWRKDDRIDLVAVYRNHDYSQLALGNFIGLCDLLEFVARESGKHVGSVTIHSVHAFVGPKGKTRALLT